MAFDFQCNHCSQKIRYASKPEWARVQIECPSCGRILIVRFSTVAGSSDYDALAAFAELDSRQLQNIVAEGNGEARTDEVIQEPTESMNPISNAVYQFKSMSKKRRIETGVIAVVCLAFAVMIGGFVASGGATVPSLEQPKPRVRKVKVPAYKDRSMGQKRGSTD